jgi:hypothetical protein
MRITFIKTVIGNRLSEASGDLSDFEPLVPKCDAFRLSLQRGALLCM